MNGSATMLRDALPLDRLVLTALLALGATTAAEAARLDEDCGRVCRDECCSCGWLVRKTHEDAPAYVDPSRGIRRRPDEDDARLRRRGPNTADVAGQCRPDHFFAEGWASDRAAQRRSATGSTSRLLRRIVLQHVDTCEACDQVAGRVELDLAVGFGISGAIDPDGDCAAWGEGWLSIAEARSGTAAAAHGGLSLAPTGWTAHSRTGSLLGSGGGLGAGIGGQHSGSLERGPDSTASEAFGDSAHASLERNSAALRWQAQVIAVGVEAERVAGGYTEEVWGHVFGQDARTAELRMEVTLGEARVTLSCDDCGHAGSRRQLVYSSERPDADGGPPR